MVNTESVRIVIGIIGNVISFFLFASPMPTIYKIIKMKAVEGFEPDPYLASILNCMMWVFYGLPFVHPHSFLIITINSVGLVLELIYILIFLIYGNNKKRIKIVVVLFIEIVFVAAIVVITMLVFHTTTRRSLFVGLICVVFNVCMYLSPLLIMKKVITTKSVKYMPFYLSLANTMNGAVWTTYALLRFDPYVLTGNGIGTLGGIAQLILYAVYYKSTPKDDEAGNAKKASEVELSGQETI